MNTGSGQQPSLAFREKEVAQLFHWIKDGESASVIGVSNVGKSNLFQHLLDRQTQKHYLGEDASRFLFLRVNFHNLPDFSNRSVYSLILEQMEELGEGEADVCLAPDALESLGRYHEALLEAGQDELKIQRYFKLAVRVCLKDPGNRLVLLFDQFDSLYQKAGEHLFNNLRGLRDTYKYRVSYLIFTRDPLPDLPLDIAQQGDLAEEEGGEEAPDKFLASNRGELAREEFCELLQPNQLYLKPYQLEDSERLLRSIAKRKSLAFEDSWILPLYQITGGHAGLLRMCFTYVATSQLDPGSLQIPSLLTVDAVWRECRRIWASLDDDEQTALASRSKNIPVGDIDQATWQKLTQKGILTGEDQIFSPLFQEFARRQKTRLDRPVFLDPRRRIVYYRGKRSQQLSKSEYLMFKKLYDRQNSVVSHAELLHACWPDEEYNEEHSLQAISSHIYRIRKRLGIADKDKLIEAKPRQGYILNNEVLEE